MTMCHLAPVLADPMVRQRILRMFMRERMNTLEIAQRLGQSEATIYNTLAHIKPPKRSAHEVIAMAGEISRQAVIRIRMSGHDEVGQVVRYDSGDLPMVSGFPAWPATASFPSGARND